jgi:hypothetical protein
MRTGMEPFLDFCSAVVYAFQQIRIEWCAWQSYRRTISQGNAECGSARLVDGGSSLISQEAIYGNE